MALTQISTAGVKDDAVTSGKIPANAVGSSEIAGDAVTSTELAANAVTTVKINNDAVNNSKLAANAVSTVKIADTAVTLAKLEHGTSSNDGKFLRANNGADPTFESLPASGVTVSNNVNNRVVTGDGTNLNAEANLTFDGSVLGVDGTSTSEVNLQTSDNTRFKIQVGSNYAQLLTQNNNDLKFKHDGGTGSGTEIAKINSNGLDIGNNKRLQVRDYYGDISGGIENSDSGNNSLRIDADPSNTSSGTGTVLLFRTDGAARGAFTANGLCFGSDTTAANALDDYEEGTYTPTITHGFASGLTYSEQYGFYRKIGTLVEFNFFFLIENTSNDTDGSHIKVSLPFTSDNTTGKRGHGHITYTNFTSMYPDNNNPQLYIYSSRALCYANGGNNFSCSNGANQANRYFIGGGVYHSAS